MTVTIVLLGRRRSAPPGDGQGRPDAPPRLRVGDDHSRINNDGSYVWAAKDREKDFIERPQHRGFLKGR